MRRGAAFVALALAVACGSVDRSGATLHHEIRPSSNATHADVVVTWNGAAPRTLDIAARSSREALRDVRTDPGDVQVAVRNGRIELPTDATALRYRVEHDAIREAGGRRSVVQVFGTDACLIEPDAYLLQSGGDLLATIETPAGWSAGVPWPLTRDGRYRVTPSTFTAVGSLAFTRHATWTLASNGCEFGIVPIEDFDSARTEVDAYVRDGAEAVAALFDGFPAERTLVIVAHSSGSTPGVVFGTCTHGGGPTLSLFVNVSLADPTRDDDWGTTHEMTHIGIPRVPREDAWFSEGLASYYQETLRARVGHIAPGTAWDRLRDGFDRGRSQLAGHTLLNDSEHMQKRHAYWRVYWSGAAIALMLDVELRRDHASSLDAAVRELRREYGSGNPPVPASQYLEHLDGWLGDAVFTRVAERWLASEGFPDVDPTLAAIGADTPVPNDDAPDAAIRRAIAR